MFVQYKGNNGKGGNYCCPKRNKEIGRSSNGHQRAKEDVGLPTILLQITAFWWSLVGVTTEISTLHGISVQISTDEISKWFQWRFFLFLAYTDFRLRFRSLDTFTLGQI